MSALRLCYSSAFIPTPKLLVRVRFLNCLAHCLFSFTALLQLGFHSDSETPRSRSFSELSRPLPFQLYGSVTARLSFRLLQLQYYRLILLYCRLISPFFSAQQVHSIIAPEIHLFFFFASVYRNYYFFFIAFPAETIKSLFILYLSEYTLLLFSFTALLQLGFHSDSETPRSRSFSELSRPLPFQLYGSVTARLSFRLRNSSFAFVF